MKLILGAVVTGGTSLAYKTGSWRDRKPIIDRELCKSCGICEEVCPDDSVKVQIQIYSIDYEYCKGCGLCAYECPADAIQMIAEER